MIALLTLTRGKERAKLLAQSKYYAERMTDYYHNLGGKHKVKHIVVDFKPEKFPDLAERWVFGIHQCKKIKAEFVVIIEDDDFYPENYLWNTISYLNQSDIVGFNYTWYYHIKKQAYKKFTHPNRSSLFTTAFRLDSFQNFKVDDSHEIFIDVKLWDFANKQNKRIAWNNEQTPIGIKHGIGKHGGIGHTMNNWDHLDRNFLWLKRRIGTEIQFYSSL